MNERHEQVKPHSWMADKAVLDRADFLEQNQDDLTRLMAESGITNPVGVVVDVRDVHGRQFALAAGMSDAEIDAEIAKHEGITIPTLTVVLSWEQARKIMPRTSPTATANLNNAWRLCSVTGQALAIAIMGKGNRYALVRLPNGSPQKTAAQPAALPLPATPSSNGPVSDGQARYRGGYRQK